MEEKDNIDAMNDFNREQKKKHMMDTIQQKNETFIAAEKTSNYVENEYQEEIVDLKARVQDLEVKLETIEQKLNELAQNDIEPVGETVDAVVWVITLLSVLLLAGALYFGEEIFNQLLVRLMGGS